MSSIRPLITITILVVVGVFLFTKINEGPTPVTPGMSDTLESAPTVNVPPLAGTANIATSTAPAPASTWSGEATADSETAPQWAGENAESVPSAAVPSATVAEATPAPMTVPAIPELPPLSPSVEASAATTPTPATAPIELPANIPTARYPNEAGTASMEPTPEPTAVASEASQIPPTTEPASRDAGRYATMPAETQSTLAAPPEPSFATSWPAIQGALERQELVQAHAMLSEWYGNPNLSPAEAEQVESLLNQLAGTVVYSTEHRLEPPYTVHAGDTLQTISQQYEVPWQLLAKINSIPAADLVQPGQQLKVIHGPFSAVVELEKGQLTLLLDGRYAGRFAVAVEPGAAASEGQWVVEQKLVNPATEASGVVSASYAAPTAVDRVLVLRSESPTATGATISITGGPASPSGPTAIAPAAFRLSPPDVEEVADILSVGSRVTIIR